MKDHPDEEVQRAAADPNAGGLSPRELAIEAAKRLKAFIERTSSEDGANKYGVESIFDALDMQDRDAETVIDYLLSLPQPDPGPITKEWLESIGAVKSEHGEGYSLWSIAISQGCGVDVDSDGEVFVEHGGEYRIMPRCLSSTRDKVLEIIDKLKGGVE